MTNFFDQIRLTCIVYGNPIPDDVTWKWSDGNNIAKGDDFNLENIEINSYQKQRYNGQLLDTSDLQFMTRYWPSKSSDVISQTTNHHYPRLEISVCCGIQFSIVRIQHYFSTLQFRFLPIYHKKDIQCMSKNSLSANEQKLTFTLNMNPNTMSIIQS